MAKKQRRVRRQEDTQQVQKFQASFQGPLPPPSMLAKYDELLPGSANRIFAMAEKQATHRQALENKVVQASASNEKTGTVLGFSLSLVVIVGGFILIWSGKDFEGLVAALAPLAILAGVFVYGKNNQRKELEEKRRIFTQD
jgi:uncharacterized membrane protein